MTMSLRPLGPDGREGQYENSEDVADGESEEDKLEEGSKNQVEKSV